MEGLGSKETTRRGFLAFAAKAAAAATLPGLLPAGMESLGNVLTSDPPVSHTSILGDLAAYPKDRDIAALFLQNVPANERIVTALVNTPIARLVLPPEAPLKRMEIRAKARPVRFDARDTLKLLTWPQDFIAPPEAGHPHWVSLSFSTGDTTLYLDFRAEGLVPQVLESSLVANNGHIAVDALGGLLAQFAQNDRLLARPGKPPVPGEDNIPEADYWGRYQTQGPLISLPVTHGLIRYINALNTARALNLSEQKFAAGRTDGNSFTRAIAEAIDPTLIPAAWLNGTVSTKDGDRAAEGLKTRIASTSTTPCAFDLNTKSLRDLAREVRAAEIELEISRRTARPQPRQESPAASAPAPHP